MNRKGQNNECKLSSVVHHHGTCLLVDPYFLRSNNSGQVDLLLVSGKSLYIFECKSNFEISEKQKARLFSSAVIMSKIMRLEVKVLLFSSEDESFYSVFQL